MSESQISARHALTQDECKFCIALIACEDDETHRYANAFRRGFLRQRKDKKWVEPGPMAHLTPASIEKRIEDECDVVKPHQISQRGKAMAKRPEIRSFLEELKRDPGDNARQLLGEQVLIGSDKARENAAGKILALEDKLGFRTAAEKHAEILSAVGAEVVIDLPGNQEAVFDMREMFPKYEEPMPPPEVMYKTMQTLDQMIWRHFNPETDLQEWKFGDGRAAYDQSQL